MATHSNHYRENSHLLDDLFEDEDLELAEIEEENYIDDLTVELQAEARRVLRWENM